MSLICLDATLPRLPVKRTKTSNQRRRRLRGGFVRPRSRRTKPWCRKKHGSGGAHNRRQPDSRGKATEVDINLNKEDEDRGGKRFSTPDDRLRSYKVQAAKNLEA